MKILRRLLLTTSLAAAVCGPASANSIVQWFTAPLGLGGGDVTDWTQNFNSSIAQYNLGPAWVLNDIKIEINATGTVDLKAINANNNGGTTFYTAQGISRFLVSNDGTNDGSLLFGTMETDPLFNTSFGTIMSAHLDNDVDYVATFNPIVGNLVSYTRSVVGGSNPLTCGLACGLAFDGPGINAADYIGNGFVPFDLGGQTLGGFSGGSVTNSSLSGTADMTVTVTYDYSAAAAVQDPATVPEPATMWLLGGALVGMGLIGRRFRKAT